MKSFLLVLIGIIIGGAGGIFGSFLTLGIGAGVGVATGLKAGACLTLEAAREQGLITAEQEPDLLRAAAEVLSAEDIPAIAGEDDTSIDCAAVVQELRSAASDGG